LDPAAIEKLDTKIKNLPEMPGVYQFKDSRGDILYIGKATNLRNRVRSYFLKKNGPVDRIAVMIKKIADLELIVTDSEVEALILEANLIKKFKPRYNVVLKDDKSYPYIVVTSEPYPRIFVTRQMTRDGSRYFGPYTDVKAMRASLKMIREIFKVRSCDYNIDSESIRKKKVKVCLDYHINKCDGPCEGLITEAQYNAMISEVVQLLRGRVGSLISHLQMEMDTASAELHFEIAAEIRDKIEQLSVYNERQKIIDPDLVDRDIFAVVHDTTDACGVVFIVREGKIVGRKHHYMSGIGGRSEAELLGIYLNRYYLDALEIPTEIFLQCEVEEASALAQWLSVKKASHVQIVIPKIGEKAKLVTLCKANARFLLDEYRIQKLTRKTRTPNALLALQKDLHLHVLPRTIECFDVSHMHGTDTVASMVVFVNGKPKKSEYRKYKLHTIDGIDDYASMREVIQRRYEHRQKDPADLPDLIVVDGGKGQLGSALDILTGLDIDRKILQGGLSNQPAVIGLAKRLEEVFIPHTEQPLTIPKSSPGLKLLQRIRNEAHRFAIQYQRTLRSKRTISTELQLVSGIGKKKAKLLLETFGSVRGIKSASLDQLTNAVGDTAAKKVQKYFDTQSDDRMI
jgi:excinuclease ABC subunit C